MYSDDFKMEPGKLKTAAFPLLEELEFNDFVRCHCIYFYGYFLFMASDSGSSFMEVTLFPLRINLFDLKSS